MDGGRIDRRASTARYAGAGASCDPTFNRLDLAPGFNLTTIAHKTRLLHDATHAQMDPRALGPVARKTAEAIGCLAEAVSGSAAACDPLGSSGTRGGVLRQQAARVAEGVLSGTSKVPADSVAVPVGTPRKDEHRFDRTADDAPATPFNGVPG